MENAKTWEEMEISLTTFLYVNKYITPICIKVASVSVKNVLAC